MAKSAKNVLAIANVIQGFLLVKTIKNMQSLLHYLTFLVGLQSFFGYSETKPFSLLLEARK